MPAWITGLIQLISLLPQVVSLIGNVITIIHGSNNKPAAMAAVAKSVAPHLAAVKAGNPKL